MKDIFTEFYNKVIGFFRQSEQQSEESSKDVARNRLRVVLMQDRTNLTPELMERMRKELIELLSKYVEMDKEALELNLEQEGDQMALMLSIPVLRAKEEDEIEMADKEEQESEESVDEAEASEDTEEEEVSEDEDESNEVEAEDEVSDTKSEDKPKKKSK